MTALGGGATAEVMPKLVAGRWWRLERGEGASATIRFIDRPHSPFPCSGS